MLGWTMRARACRSDSKRATTWAVSIPGLMILSATLRCTGCTCSAMKTTPKPPSPIFSSSLYEPTRVPRAFGDMMLANVRHSLGRRLQETGVLVINAEHGFEMCDCCGVAGTGLFKIQTAYVRRVDLPCHV